MVHVERLRAALDYIVAHPEEWQQSHWIVRTDCGTAGCLAGVTAIKIMGATPILHLSQNTAVNLEHDSIKHFDFVGNPREVDYVSRFAQLALELTNEQTEELFDSSNTLHDLYWYANDYTNGEIEIPEEIAALPRFIDEEEED